MNIILKIILSLLYLLLLLIEGIYNAYTYFQVVPLNEYGASVSLSDGVDYGNIDLIEVKHNKWYFNFIHPDGRKELMNFPKDMFFAKMSGIMRSGENGPQLVEQEYVSSKGIWCEETYKEHYG